MNYNCREQAFLERCKDGTFPSKVYEVLDDERCMFFTPHLEAAMEANVLGTRTIRTHRAEVK